MKSIPVTAGETTRIEQYNELRDDVIFNREKVLPKFSCAYDMPEKTFVGVSDCLPNSVFKANNNIDFILDNAPAGIRARPAGGQLSNGRFFYIYSDGTGQNLYACVGEISDDGTITKGEEVIVTTDLQTTQSNRDVFFSATELTDNKFAVFYSTESLNANIYCRVYDTTGVEITTEGSENFIDGGTSFISWTKCARLNDDVAVLCFEWGSGASSNTRAIVVTVTGTTASGGTAVAIDSAFIDGQSTAVTSVSTDAFVIYLNGTGGRFQAGSISGTTISMGSVVTYSASSTNTEIRTSIVSPTENIFVARLAGASQNSSSVIAGSVSGNTITLGDEVALTPESNLSSNNHGVLFLFDNKIYANSRNGGVASFTLDGTTIENMKLEGFNAVFMSVNFSSIAFVSNDRYGWVNGASSTNQNVFLSGNSSSYIGYVKEASSKGDIVEVITKGVVETSTEILVGGNYNVFEGGLQRVSLATKIIGISENKVLLK